MVDLTDIPTLGDKELAVCPFPKDIEPFDSEWWLNEKEKAVCDAYLGDCQLDQQCSYAVSFSSKNKNSLGANSTRFFKKAKVRRYLWIRMRELSEKVNLSQEMILKDLVEVVQMAMGRKPKHMVLGIDKDGMPVSDYAKDTDLKAANQALTQLGKYHELAMWTEKHEHEVQVVNFNFDMGEPPKKVVSEQ